MVGQIPDILENHLRRIASEPQKGEDKEKIIRTLPLGYKN